MFAMISMFAIVTWLPEISGPASFAPDETSFVKRNRLHNGMIYVGITAYGLELYLR